jgi:hypothetical protein
MNFDLNINNYSYRELLDLFDLSPQFDTFSFEKKDHQLRENILNNPAINPQVKKQTIDFLVNAKEIILFKNPNNSNNNPNNNSNNNNPINNIKDKLEDFYNRSYEMKPTSLESANDHMVQSRTNKPYLSSYPSEFFPGTINPIKKRTIKKNLNIDSRFRDNYYSSFSSNFNVHLPLNINNVVQMQLTAIELPTSYFVVSKQYNNNYFNIQVNDHSTTITIPDGNYNENGIMEIINTQLALAGSPFNYISFIINLVGTRNGTAQTLVGCNEQGSGLVTSIGLDFQADKTGLEDHNTPLPLKFGWMLGFRNGVYSGNLNYVSEGIVDFTGSRYFYLVLDDFTNNVNNNFYSAFNSSILNKNILARISLQSNIYSILQQNNLNITTTPREYFGPINLQNMTVQLLDEYGRIVDLNNMDFSFCLLLTTVYDL